MYHIKDDQRSIRSSEMLYDGLVKLMRETQFTSITVKDLVEAAQVGRATFYRNFDEIEDVLRWRCDQVFEGLIAYKVEYVRIHGARTNTVLLKPLLRYFHTHSEIIELLMIANRLDIVQASLRRVLDPFKAQAAAQFGVSQTKLDYLQTIRVAVTTSILVQWIETGKHQPPDELADELREMIENMITLDQLL